MTTSGMMNIRNHEEYNCNIDRYPLEMLAKFDDVLFDDFGS
jgi:hypothetical protein